MVSPYTVNEPPASRKAVIYPDSDGKPMADNTKQWRYISMLKHGFDALFAGREDVFVAGDLLWYPIEGDNKTRIAPDVLIAFGRPRGDRGSYRQWEEGGLPPQVVFEVLSPSNRSMELIAKFNFYQRHGVEEFYEYDPQLGELTGWVRKGDELMPVVEMENWTSPLTGCRFELDGLELQVTRPDGVLFEDPAVLYVKARYEAARAEQEAARAEQEAARAEQEAARAEQEAARAELEAARADNERRQKEDALAKMEALAQQLRALGVDPG